MYVLILISSLHVGGAEKQAVNDANMLCGKHKVCLMVFEDGLLKNKLKPEVEYIQIEKKGYWATAGTIAKYISQNKIDLIYASLFAPMIIGALASLQSNVPVIWSFHSHEYDIPFKSRWSYNLLSRINCLKKIIYVNKELKDFFEDRLKMPKSKSEVLYNTTKFKPRNIKKFNDKVIIGYVGRIIPLKRVEYLIDLAARLVSRGFNDFVFHILGDGDSREEIENRVKEVKLDDKFVFYGFQTELEEYYDNFDIFINPSREECLSIALIDAGIKGIPSIAFDVGGNNEIILDNKTGFIVNSKDELFDRTKRLMENATLRDNFSREAVIHCTRNFTEDKRLIRLTEIFKSAVN